MGKKSRLKRERKERKIQEKIDQPVKSETRIFLSKRGVAAERGAQLSYIVSMLVNFMIYHSVKEGIQLPSVRPDEEEVDGARMDKLYRELGERCQELDIEYQEVGDELVVPLAENESLVGQVLKKIYDILESLIPTESFRQLTEGQIENPETWGDSLTHYADRKENYFEAIKELFGFSLSIVRSDVEGGGEEINPEKELTQIKEKHGIESDDFEKLRRRATEFLRVAFANYLEMDFQRVRLELDARTYRMGPERNKSVQ